MASFFTPLKSALITGGSRGIGLAIAQRFAREGIACSLVARDPERLAKAVSTLPDTGPPHTTSAGDVGDPRYWRQLFSPLNKVHPVSLSLSLSDARYSTVTR